MVEPVEVDEANHAGKISTPVLSSRSGCQQRGETKNTLPSRAAGWLSTALNVWWISQGESERSERSQIEDVTNYSSNVAQGSQAIDRPKPYTQPRQRSSYGHYSATQDRTTAGVQLGHITHASVIQLVGILVLVYWSVKQAHAGSEHISKPETPRRKHQGWESIGDKSTLAHTSLRSLRGRAQRP